MAQTTKGDKHAPQIDMTPMVDLAFLLITFFMLATSLAQPKTMEIIKPAHYPDEVNNPVVNKKRVRLSFPHSSLTLAEIDDKVSNYCVNLSK